MDLAAGLCGLRAHLRRIERYLHAPDGDGPDAVESGENANEKPLPYSLNRKKS